MPVDHRSHKSKQWPAPLHLTDPFILEAHWHPEMKEEDSAQCLLSPRPHMRVEGRGLASPPAASVPETPNVGFGRGVGVINVCTSINGQPGPTQALSPTISKQGLPNIKRQIFYIKYYFNHI